MHNSNEYTQEFKVSVRNLTDEQIYSLNGELKYFVRKLLIVSIILFIALFFPSAKLLDVFDYLYAEATLISPEFMIPFFVDHYRSATGVTALILLFLAGYLSNKFYSIVGHYVISSKVKNLELKNLESKVEELGKQVNPPRIEKPVAPEVQKEVNKIRALGKTK